MNSAVCQPKDVKQALSERRYDALVTLGKVDLPGIRSVPVLTDRAYLSVPQDNGLIDREEIALADIPAQPLLLVRDAGYFVRQLRNDGTGRKLIPVTDPELTVQYYITFLNRNRNKLEQFLDWAAEITRKCGVVTAL